MGVHCDRHIRGRRSRRGDGALAHAPGCHTRHCFQRAHTSDRLVRAARAHAWSGAGCGCSIDTRADSHTDRHATFAALAGVSTAGTGPVAPDGYNIWPALASGGSVPSPRTFIIHEFDELEKIFAYRSVRHHPTHHCCLSPKYTGTPFQPRYSGVSGGDRETGS